LAQEENDILISRSEDLQQLEAESIQLENYYSALSTSQIDILDGMDMLRSSNNFGADLFVEAMGLLTSV